MRLQPYHFPIALALATLALLGGNGNAQTSVSGSPLPQQTALSSPLKPPSSSTQERIYTSPLAGVLAITPGTMLPPAQQPKGDLGQAVTNLRRLDVSGAKRELYAFESEEMSRTDEVHAAFLRGAIEVAEGAYERAANTYRSIRNGLPGLRVEIAAREGRALRKSGAFKSAGDRLNAAATAAPKGPIANGFRLEAARAYTQAGWFKTADFLLTALAEGEDGGPSEAKIQLSQAELELARKRLTTARLSLQTLQAEAKDCAIVQTVTTHLSDLATNGTPDAPGTIHLELDRVSKLISCQAYEDAETRLMAISPVFPAEQLEGAWIRLWYRRWDLEQVKSYADSRLQSSLPDNERAIMMRWQARAAWREGHAEKAADLRANAAALKKSPMGKNDEHYLALLYTEAHAYDKANPMLNNVLSGRLSKRKRVEALWYQAWGNLTEGNLDLAKTQLATFAARYPKENRGVGALYWLARIDILEGNGAEAAKKLEALETSHPDSFYVFLAQTLKLSEAALTAGLGKGLAPNGLPLLKLPEGDVRIASAQALVFPDSLALPPNAPLMRSRPTLPSVGETPFLDLPSPLRTALPRDVEALQKAGIEHLQKLNKTYGNDIPELPIALALVNAGFTAEANPWLEAAYQRGRKSNNALEKRFSRERTALYYAFWLVSNPLQSIRLDPTGWPFPTLNLADATTTDPWKNRYPRVFAEEVSHAYFSWGVDPSLIYGIMRTESMFGPHQVSPVGARGLMQIMPRTGAHISSLLEEPFELDDLFNPGTNIWYGSWYLKELLERFDGQLPLAIAAYNAGPKYVSNWIHRSGEVPVDVFIEEIPIGQTRKYVKKVLRAMAIYRGLYAGTPQLPLSATLSPDDREGVDF